MPDLELPQPARRPLVYPWMMGMAAIVLGQILYYAPRLPERVASHFDASGNANGFMERSAFLALMGGLVLGLIGMFWLIMFLIPRLPTSTINMPNREYWMEESRREATYHAITRNLLGHTVLMVAFLAWLFHATYRFNTTANARATLSIWVPLAVYLGGTGLLIWALLRRFKLPTEGPSV